MFSSPRVFHFRSQILWLRFYGNSPLSCLETHHPHPHQLGQTTALRRPVYLSLGLLRPCWFIDKVLLSLGSSCFKGKVKQAVVCPFDGETNRLIFRWSLTSGAAALLCSRDELEKRLQLHTGLFLSVAQDVCEARRAPGRHDKNNKRQCHHPGWVGCSADWLVPSGWGSH